MAVEHDPGPARARVGPPEQPGDQRRVRHDHRARAPLTQVAHCVDRAARVAEEHGELAETTAAVEAAGLAAERACDLAGAARDRAPRDEGDGRAPHERLLGWTTSGLRRSRDSARTSTE